MGNDGNSFRSGPLPENFAKLETVYMLAASADGRSWMLVGEPAAFSFTRIADALLTQAEFREVHPQLQCEVHPIHPHLLSGLVNYTRRKASGGQSKSKSKSK